LISLYDATLLNSGSVKVEIEQDVVADSTGSTGLLSNVKGEQYNVEEGKELVDVVGLSNTKIDDGIQTYVSNSIQMKQLVMVTYFNNTNTTRNEVGTTETSEKQKKEPTCQTCGHKCKSASALVIHEQIHSGEPPFSCQLCNKKFYRKPSLTQHVRVHSKDDQLSCTVCNKKFSRNDHLNVHMRIHTGEKPFSCTICMKAFTHRSSLTQHAHVHSGEKPYCCNICSKAYASSSSLSYHKRKCGVSNSKSKPLKKNLFNSTSQPNVTINPYESKSIYTSSQQLPTEDIHVCEHCGVMFDEKQQLLKHKTVHTQPQRFQCDKCNKVFFTKFSLSMHLQMHKLV